MTQQTQMVVLVLVRVVLVLVRASAIFYLLMNKLMARFWSLISKM